MSDTKVCKHCNLAVRQIEFQNEDPYWVHSGTLKEKCAEHFAEPIASESAPASPPPLSTAPRWEVREHNSHGLTYGVHQMGSPRSDEGVVGFDGEKLPDAKLRAERLAADLNQPLEAAAPLPPPSEPLNWRELAKASEQAAPSASPLMGFEASDPKFSPTAAEGERPVKAFSTDGGETWTQADRGSVQTALPDDWKKLPVGAWFFYEADARCVHRYSVMRRTDSGCELVCSTPWTHEWAKRDMAGIAERHNASLPGVAVVRK